MKANTKYTALEILTEAGVETPEEKFGKFKVRIAGLRGIVTPDHLVKFGPEVKNVEVIVGVEKYEVEILGEAPENTEISEGAREALDAKGKKATEKSEKLQAEKKAAKEEKPTKKTE